MVLIFTSNYSTDSHEMKVIESTEIAFPLTEEQVIPLAKQPINRNSDK